MKYYIISKVESIGGGLNYTSVGYVTSKEDADYIREGDKIEEAVQWSKDNQAELIAGTKTLDDFMIEIGVEWFYVTIQESNCIDGFGLNEITDLDNPEGV